MTAVDRCQWVTVIWEAARLTLTIKDFIGQPLILRQHFFKASTYCGMGVWIFDLFFIKLLTYILVLLIRFLGCAEFCFLTGCIWILYVFHFCILTCLFRHFWLVNVYFELLLFLNNWSFLVGTEVTWCRKLWLGAKTSNI